MRKFNYHVEVEINGQWVHAYVNTLAEAKALLAAFEQVDHTKMCIFDDNIFLNKDADDQAQAEFAAYTQECLDENLAYLNDLVATGKATLENGVYKGRLVDL